MKFTIREMSHEELEAKDELKIAKDELEIKKSMLNKLAKKRKIIKSKKKKAKAVSKLSQQISGRLALIKALIKKKKPVSPAKINNAGFIKKEERKPMSFLGGKIK